MSDDRILAALVAQAEGQGADMVTLRALIEEAAEAGARRAGATAAPAWGATRWQNIAEWMMLGLGFAIIALIVGWLCTA